MIRWTGLAPWEFEFPFMPLTPFSKQGTVFWADGESGPKVISVLSFPPTIQISKPA